MSELRFLVTLKAALNYCWREGNTPSDDAWRKVRPFAGTVSARIKYLTVSETQRLTNACEEPFRSLVRAALATGCSYGELGRLVAETSTRRPARRSKSGKPRHVVLEAEGIALFRQLTAGRAGSDLIFRTQRGGEWRPSVQDRPMKIACERARLDPPISFHILRHTWASHATMNGLPLMIVAKISGTPTRRWLSDFMATWRRPTSPTPSARTHRDSASSPIPRSW
jgi:integrase